MKKIVEFYGIECSDCVLADPMVTRLEKEEDVEVEKLEVWHSEENKKKMETLKSLFDKECKGDYSVPAFYDPDEERLLCEPMNYEELRSWVLSS